VDDDIEDEDEEDEDESGDSLPPHRSGSYQQAAVTDDAEEKRDLAMEEEAEDAELRPAAGRDAASLRQDASEALLAPDAQDSSSADGKAAEEQRRPSTGAGG
jgi:hypothetical protein